MKQPIKQRQTEKIGTTAPPDTHQFSVNGWQSRRRPPRTPTVRHNFIEINARHWLDSTPVQMLEVVPAPERIRLLHQPVAPNLLLTHDSPLRLEHLTSNAADRQTNSTNG